MSASRFWAESLAEKIYNPQMTAPTTNRLDRTKLREAVHFVCKKYALQTEKLGAVKLQKVIWYFDAKCFAFNQQTATGATFIKGNHGPYTRDIQVVISDLVAADRLFTDTQDYFESIKARFVGRGVTDLSVFSDREQRWLDEISSDICENHTAGSISERSHGPVWQMAQYGEEIPFAATVVRFRKPSQEAVEALRNERI
jgi:hypothetical protein